MSSHSLGIARKATAILVIVVVLIAFGGYALWAYETGQPPFCSGYPPGGNCRGNYSYSFEVTVNYTGQWKAAYYGYHSVGVTQFDGAGNYTNGIFNGTGINSRYVTLSGPNNNGLTLCVSAEKLDSSSSILALGFDGWLSNSTSLPYGRTTLCGGVAP